MSGLTVFYLLVACFFWAISFVASKVALLSVPPLTVVFLRLTISAVCFLLWLALRRPPLPIWEKGILGHLILLSLIGTSLHYGAQTIGLQYTTATNASVYSVTAPLSILLLAAVFSGERINLKKGIGISLALIGVLLVMGPERLSAFDFKGYLLGDLLVIFSIFLWGVFTVYGKKITGRIGALELTAVVTVIGALTMLPMGFLEMAGKGMSFAEIPLRAWLAIGFLGVTCSFLATLLYFMALRQTESQKVGVFLYTLPPMTYIFSALFLGESATLYLLAGSTLVLGGVYLTERG